MAKSTTVINCDNLTSQGWKEAREDIVKDFKNILKTFDKACDSNGKDKKLSISINASIDHEEVKKDSIGFKE